MLSHNLLAMLERPASAPLALIEGRWFDGGREHGLLAYGPAGVLEGGLAALQELPAWLDWHSRRHPSGAAIGYLAYELARFFETLPLATEDGLPDVSFAYYPYIEELPPVGFFPAPAPQSAEPEIITNFSKHTFIDAVEMIRSLIAAGDVYQANLTQQFRTPLGWLSPAQLYARLACGRAPFRAFLRTPRCTIVSNSPERFFRVAGDRILASPIKGTIARADDPDEDGARLASLLSSPKDRAENIMIVDLLRNDLGRVCQYESIRARPWDVEALPHLYHLVSHVEGRVRPDVGVLEILRALFPCGSITGAPKIRAMEILAEIERIPRGVSMGAIGIIRQARGAPGLEIDFNVAIRTMTIQEGTAVFNVGGGIVYDSRPEAEYEEMMLKASPLLEALGVKVPSETTALETRVLAV